MTTAEIVNLILKKLRTSRVEFLDINPAEVAIRYAHHEYIISWNESGLNVSPHYPELVYLDEMNYCLWLQRVLQGWRRDDKGNLSDPKAKIASSLNECPSSNQKPSAETTDWISANDLLPNDSRWVLIACAAKGMTEFDVCQAFRDREKGGWTSADGGFCQHVRYWAELPKGPKK